MTNSRSPLCRPSFGFAFPDRSASSSQRQQPHGSSFGWDSERVQEDYMQEQHQLGGLYDLLFQASNQQFLSALLETSYSNPVIKMVWCEELANSKLCHKNIALECYFHLFISTMKNEVKFRAELRHKLIAKILLKLNKLCRVVLQIKFYNNWIVPINCNTHVFHYDIRTS